MTSLIRFRPFRGWNIPAPSDFEGLEPECAIEDWAPRVDILNEEKAILISADLPGLEREDIHLGVDHGTLTISGDRKFEQVDKRDNFTRVERSFGTFSRSFYLPDDVDIEKIDAKLDRGVLRVTLPKTEAARPREIKVRAA